MPVIFAHRRPTRRRLGGTSRLVLASACLLVAALLPGSASADPPRGQLVVQGNGGTTTELELTRDVYLRTPVPVLRGGGDYVGVLVERVDARPSEQRRLGGLQVRAFRDGTSESVMPLGGSGHLAPGRYRVTLFGAGAVRASFLLAEEQGPGLQVVPRTPIEVRFLGRADPLPAGQSGAVVDLGRSLPRGKRAVQAVLLESTRVDRLQMCATTGSQCQGSPRLSVGTGTGRETMFASVIDPDRRDRSLLWSVDGYRLEDDRLRAAALVF